MREAPAASPSDLYADLAARLADEEQRQLLHVLLEQLAKGGGPAVLEEVRRRLRAILDDDL
ncbi:MAG TPA: hypothetical protein VGP33_03980 [Chloroflexota bacterium]|jgi:hypothetical protein|nr:hypothetical protein [Chloroflexota bacterium]